jgi:hypothetical protein
MKCKWALMVAGVSALLLGGCHRAASNQTNSVRVVVEGGGAFPSFLAGHWKAQQYGWEFVFEPDGRISSAVIGLGRVQVVPGRTTTMPTKSGGQAIFTPGPWVVHYAPGTGELTVEITMDHVRVEMAGNILEGSSTDTFVGPLAPTERTWRAQWTIFTRYRAHTPANRVVDLSTDPTYGETKPVIFERTAEDRK